MSKDITVTNLDPVANIVRDELTEFIRASATKVLQQAVETEIMELLEQLKNKRLDDGKQRVVRNGYLPPRDIQTGIGKVKVKLPRVRDRGNSTNGITFVSNLVPKYMRRTATLDVMLPLLYLKGISTLKQTWYNEYQSWQQQDLSDKSYVYWWVDGVYLRARSETDKNCMLVIVGADKDGKKELVALFDGFRESKESWKSLLRDLKSRGLTQAPKLAIGDGALGFWGAINEMYPSTQHQRCWVHKTANILDKLPKSLHSQAKTMLHEIYLAETTEKANAAFDLSHPLILNNP